MLKLLFAAAALSAATPIIATAQDAPVSVRVSVADLDLVTAAGQATLDRRIARAVNKICPTDWNAELSRQMRTRACRADVLAAVTGQRSAAIADAAAHRSGATSIAMNAAAPR